MCSAASPCPTVPSNLCCCQITNETEMKNLTPNSLTRHETKSTLAHSKCYQIGVQFQLIPKLHTSLNIGLNVLLCIYIYKFEVEMDRVTILVFPSPIDYMLRSFNCSLLI